MAMLTVRSLPESVHRALRVQAALQGLSTEAEAMKPEPDATVRAWLNAQAAQTLDGLMGLYRDRVLPFDFDAARHYAEWALTARVEGRGFPTPDGYIAAIAASRGFIVASRDTAPYKAAKLTVINPWELSEVE